MSFSLCQRCGSTRRHAAEVAVLGTGALIAVALVIGALIARLMGRTGGSAVVVLVVVGSIVTLIGGFAGASYVQRMTQTTSCHRRGHGLGRGRTSQRGT